MATGKPFSCLYFEDISANVTINATSNLAFDSTIITINEGGLLALTNASNLTLSRGSSLYNSKINGGGGSITFEDNSYIHAGTLYNAHLHGVVNIQDWTPNFTGSAVYVEDTLQNYNSSNENLQVADLVNNGFIRNNPSGGLLYIEQNGNLTNNGIIANKKFTFKNTINQVITMAEGRLLQCEVSLLAEKSGASSYQWKLNDANLADKTSNELFYAFINYKNIGTYTCATDVGTSRSISLNYQGSIAIASSSFSADVTSGVSPLTVSFTNTSTNATNYLWYFGDGTTSSEKNPVHIYSTSDASKKFDVALKVWNSISSDSISKIAYIQLGESISASFSASKTSGTIPLEVAFTDLSTGNITSWEWDFNNDGTVDSYLQNPTYTFTTAGTYTVKLTVKNSNSFSSSKTLTINANGNTETEPNETFGTATLITLNSSITGSFSLNSDIDWYKVSIPYDGSLLAIGTPSSALNIYVNIYDANGLDEKDEHRFQGDAGQTDTTWYKSFKAGTYYIKVTPDYYKYTGTYTLTAQLLATAIPEGNDAEPNGTYDKAVTLALNSSTSGHIGYSQNGTVDEEDWFKITLPYDGTLICWATPEATLNTYLTIFDANGIDIKNEDVYSGGKGANDTVRYKSFKAGTYYVKVTHDYYDYYGSYTLGNKFISTQIPEGNDAEPNGTYDKAVTFALNSSTTGHIGYSQNGTVDEEDWFKITLPFDGTLICWSTPEATLNTYLTIFDANGIDIKNEDVYSGSKGVNDTVRYKSFKAGTYYVKVTHDYYDYYGSYTLGNKFISTGIPEENDAEPNDNALSAQVILLNVNKVGHIGYQQNGETDNEDWYSVSIADSGCYLFVVKPEATLDTNIDLYKANNDYVTGCTSCGNAGIADTIRQSSLTAGMYLVKISHGYYDYYGSYMLKIEKVTNSENVISKAYSVSIYPNPSSGTVYVWTNYNLRQTIDFEIVDISGKVQLKGYTSIDNGKIDLSKLSKGVYFIKLKFDHSVQTEKIVIE
jgi:PKD repeat protein